MKWLPVLFSLLLIGAVAVMVIPGHTDPGGDWNGRDFSTIGDIPPPEGYETVSVDSGSFAAWIRSLPLREEGTPVILYNGKPKPSQQYHYAVLDLEIGEKDLQQCADAAIRFRAEYLYSQKKFDSISFNFTSGDTASFRKWIEGYRPRVNGNHVSWTKSAEIDSSYGTFKKYLDTVYMYAGSYSLSKQLMTKDDTDSIEIGDLFLEGGFPGHTVIAVNVASHKETGKKIFLLAQGFMPAQDIHIVKNLNDPGLSPWYSTDFGDSLDTPEWTFDRNTLMTF